MMRAKIILCGMAAVFAQASLAAGPSPVVADTFVEADEGSKNAGSAGSVIIKNNPINNINVRIGFLRFDLSGEDGTFQRTDGLNMAISNADVPPYEFEIWGLNANTSWDESTLTWATANSDVVTIDTGYTGQDAWGFDTDAATLLATCDTPSDATPTYEFFCGSANLVSYMNSNIGESDVTLLIRRTDTDAKANFAFLSKEAAAGPDDEVGFYIPTFGAEGRFGGPEVARESVPVPTLPIWSLLGLVSALGWIARRRLRAAA